MTFPQNSDHFFPMVPTHDPTNDDQEISEDDNAPPWYTWPLAFFHLSNHYICAWSAQTDEYDYHDYTDSAEEEPWHFVKLRCERCGKRFYT